MPAVSPVNNIISNIVIELKKLDAIEQKELLAQLRAKRLLRRKVKPLASSSKPVKPLTMAEIDKIKHLSRKSA
jgi:hypothetical protein